MGRQYTDSYYGAEGRITYAVQRLILANIVVFVAQLLLHVVAGSAGERGVEGDTHLLIWLAFSKAGLADGYLWTPLTYMFLHGGLIHLFVNMLWLFFFGPDVEHALGTRQFFFFYLLCGIASVFVTVIPVPLLESKAMVLGASGAMMAVLAAFAVINPERQLFFFPIPFPINARALVIIVIILNVLLPASDEVSVGTHLGGLAAGYAYMKIRPAIMAMELRAKAPKSKPRDPVGEAVDNIFRFEDKKKRWKK
jgi:membrane associated rhomboid family serine protease